MSGSERPPEEVFAYFRRLHGLEEDEFAALDRRDKQARDDQEDSREPPAEDNEEDE